MPLEIGQRIKQVTRSIAGAVEDIKYDKEAKSFAYLMSYDSDGEEHQRWFQEGEVEADAEAQAKADAEKQGEAKVSKAKTGTAS